MASFKVIALSLGGLRNKVYSSGDVVTQEQLPTDAAELVAKGFLQPIQDEKPEPKSPEPSILEAVQSQSVSEWPSIDEMSVKEIKAALGDKAPKGFTPKAELYALLVG